jgi:hypothetical protein
MSAINGPSSSFKSAFKEIMKDKTGVDQFSSSTEAKLTELDKMISKLTKRSDHVIKKVSLKQVVLKREAPLGDTKLQKIWNKALGKATEVLDENKQNISPETRKCLTTAFNKIVHAPTERNRFPQSGSDIERLVPISSPEEMIDPEWKVRSDLVKSESEHLTPSPPPSVSEFKSMVPNKTVPDPELEG